MNLDPLQSLLDSLETDIDRQRNMAPELKVSMLAKVGQLRKMKLLKAISFDGLVEHGKANGGNIVNGMPWSFSYEGHPVTHENDQCYLIGNDSQRFTPDAVLVVSKSGKLVFFRD